MCPGRYLIKKEGDTADYEISSDITPICSTVDNIGMIGNVKDLGYVHFQT